MAAARLRERIGDVRSRTEEQASSGPMRALVMRSTGQRSEHVAQLMRFLRFNPDIAPQNVIAWKLVFAVASIVAVVGFFYGRAFLGWPLALLVVPVEGLLVARFIFGWERARFQKALLEQVPEVMALICRAVAAGIPLSEAIRSVSQEAADPSREEFVRVVNEVAIGQPLESALWKLYDRVGLPEYAFFAVTIGLQAQTGGSMVETLQNLQDMVRKRVALSKRGKALAAEARMSAIILGVLPFVMCLILSFMQPGFLDFFFRTLDRQPPVAHCCRSHEHGYLRDAPTDPPEPRPMTRPAFVLLTIWRRHPGAGRGRIPAALPGSQRSGDCAPDRRAAPRGGRGETPVVALLAALVSLMRRLGNVMRDRMMSAKDAEALAKTLAAAGLEPAKAMPIFIGAKIACLFVVPVLIWMGTVFLGYPTGSKQFLLWFRWWWQ